MTSGQARRAVWAGTITAFLLVAGFGNQWLWEKLLKKDDVGENSGWHILGWLNTPHWVVDSSGFFEDLDGKYVAGYIVGVVGLLITVAVVLSAAARRGDGFNAFLVGWFSLALGGAVYELASYLISGSPYGYPIGGREGDRSLSGTLNCLASGGGYGLLAGWVVGLVCVLVMGGGRYAPQHSYAAPPPPPANPPQAGGYRY